MKIESIKNIVPKLSKNAFYEYWKDLFSHLYGICFAELEGSNGTIYRRFVNSNHVPEWNYYPPVQEAAYIFHYFIDFSKNKTFNEHILRDPSFLKKIDYVKTKYSGRVPSAFYDGKLSANLYTMYIITNFYGYDKEIYKKQIIKSLKDVIVKEKDFKYLVESPGIGSFDTSLSKSKNFSEIEYALKKLFNHENLIINLNPTHANVNSFFAESVLNAGVSEKSKYIYEPVFLKLQKSETIRIEFEKLINQNPNEKTLEEFIRTYYREIFGFKYDRIETQLWLRFPEIDIGNKNRRIDMFLRNSVINDWELFELKRSSVKLTSTYRDAPVLSKEIINSIHQLKNYYRLFSQDKVRKQLQMEGIEYYEPALNLVIGNKPQVSHQQWRYLLSEQKDINILTYHELLKELKLRDKETNILYDEFNKME